MLGNSDPTLAYKSDTRRRWHDRTQQIQLTTSDKPTVRLNLPGALNRFSGLPFTSETGDEKTAQAPRPRKSEKFQSDRHWRDNILFYEYLHGDSGAGLGASHQMGWTGVWGG